MITKKDLQKQIDASFQLLTAIQKQIDEIGKTISMDGSRIYDLERGQTRDLENIRKGSDLIRNNMTYLRKQIECGAAGHDFKLNTVLLINHAVTVFDGVFKCKHCGVEITRELTKQEIEAAKKLGMIK